MLDIQISIHANHFAINRLPSNFVRPDEFIPERWASDATDFADDRKASFQPFAAGVSSIYLLQKPVTERKLTNSARREIVSDRIWRMRRCG